MSMHASSEAVPVQKQVGDKIMIFCNFPESLLDETEVYDQSGAHQKKWL